MNLFSVRIDILDQHAKCFFVCGDIFSYMFFVRFNKYLTIKWILIIFSRYLFFRDKIYGY